MMNSAKARLLVLSLTLFAVGGCLGENASGAKHLRPLSYATLAELKEKDMRKEDPILVRIFKEESELEVWKQRRDGRYALFKSYDICKWSGQLGPKIKEGDRQAPEGFYTITPAQMNPNSNYHLAFNIGFPNTFDRAHGRTGKYLMVHGACSSAGCYAMTDDVIQEIYSLAREAFRADQREFQVQALPFRMTPENMARHAGDPNTPFWRNLKEGSDHFEVTGLTPKIGVCEKRYVFNAKPESDAETLDPVAVCPKLDVPDQIEVAVARKQMRDETAFQVALADIRNKAITEEQATPVMVAANMPVDEGSNEGYETASAGPVTKASVEEVPAVEPATTGSINAAAPMDIQPQRPNPMATAFTGMWDRIVGLARFDALTKPAAFEPAADASGEASPVADPEAMPEISAASSFAPQPFARDPFSVFGLFETVDGVSVPADTMRR